MSKNPKIFVFHLKEVIYTAVFLAFAILLIILLSIMFNARKTENSIEEETTYKAGVYTSAMNINGTPMEIQVTLDKNNINSVEFKNIDDSVSAMYPLVMSSMEDISNQLITSQSIDSISFSDESKYTYSLLLSNIENILNKARQ